MVDLWMMDASMLERPGAGAQRSPSRRDAPWPTAVSLHPATRLGRRRRIRVARGGHHQHRKLSDRQREKTAERIARADMPLIAQLLLIELDRGGGGA